MKKSFVTLILFFFLTIPCLGGDFTLGTVQQQIHEGMPQSDIVSCLGAPNVVTKSSGNCETWVYETKSEYSTETYHKSWLWLLFFGRRKGCQYRESGQKTMTLILNFDENSCLKNYSYKSNHT